jgi:hypothetical protein
MNSKLLISVLFFIFIFIFGYWLNRTGKPYSTGLLNLHKLIGLAAGVFLGVSVYRMANASPVNTLDTVAIVVTVLFFLSLVITGGLLSIDKPMPQVVSLIHKSVPYLTVASTGVRIHTLFG